MKWPCDDDPLLAPIRVLRYLLESYPLVRANGYLVPKGDLGHTQLVLCWSRSLDVFVKTAHEAPTPIIPIDASLRTHKEWQLGQRPAPVCTPIELIEHGRDGWLLSAQRQRQGKAVPNDRGVCKGHGLRELGRHASQQGYAMAAVHEPFVRLRVGGERTNLIAALNGKDLLEVQFGRSKIELDHGSVRGVIFTGRLDGVHGAPSGMH